MGELSKKIALIGAEYQDRDLYLRLLGANTFQGGEAFSIGDIRIRPLVIDHSVRIVICLSLKQKVNVSYIQVISGCMGCAIMY